MFGRLLKSLLGRSSRLLAHTGGRKQTN
uniref:Uncharacterized protein n=1 Tax=Anopheles minimus TaxID=112268 RepID=A0A182WN58_9DIPT